MPTGGKASYHHDNQPAVLPQKASYHVGDWIRNGSVDKMNLNPYDSHKLTSGVESVWSMLYAAAIRPMPVRRVASTKPRWLQAIFHACAIVFAALAVAPLLTFVLDFLGPMAFPTSVIICCFPIYIWMYYCRISGVGRDSNPVPVGLALSLILSFAAVEGLAALHKILLSLAILIPVLATEWLIGKVLLAALTRNHASVICDLSATEHIKSYWGLGDASLRGTSLSVAI